MESVAHCTTLTHWYILTVQNTENIVVSICNPLRGLLLVAAGECKSQKWIRVIDPGTSFRMSARTLSVNF